MSALGEALPVRPGVRPGGLEPPTRCLEGSRSIHLSYGRLTRHFSAMFLAHSV